MKKLSFYTILCCLAVVCTFSLNSCQEFNIDSQAEFPPLLETIGICRISQIPEYDYFQYQFQYSLED